MPKYTENLNLYEIDTVEDASKTFNFDTALNDNWDKLDESVTKIDDDVTALSGRVDTLEANKTITVTGAVKGSATLKKNTSELTIKTELGTSYGMSGLTAFFTACMPDWDSAVALDAKTTYTATEAGWVRWYRHENDKDYHLLVNEKICGCVRAAGSHDACGSAVLVPVTVGDTYRCTGKSQFEFYPLRGA